MTAYVSIGAVVDRIGTVVAIDPASGSVTVDPFDNRRPFVISADRLQQILKGAADASANAGAVWAMGGPAT